MDIDIDLDIDPTTLTPAELKAALKRVQELSAQVRAAQVLLLMHMAVTAEFGGDGG